MQWGIHKTSLNSHCIVINMHNYLLQDQMIEWMVCVKERVWTLRVSSIYLLSMCFGGNTLWVSSTYLLSMCFGGNTLRVSLTYLLSMCFGGNTLRVSLTYLLSMWFGGNVEMNTECLKIYRKTVLHLQV